MRKAFDQMASVTADVFGTYSAFLVALTIVLAWAVSGPLFHFSDSWQLVINTGTTIVTFLMVFLIQATQNRESRALHLKLDEIIRSQRNARNLFTGLEHASDEELDQLEREFTQIRARAKMHRSIAHEGDAGQGA